MAVRIRKSGKVLCAAMFPEEQKDIYLDDHIHYLLSVEFKVLVTDDKHFLHGEWWWVNKIPNNIEILDFYKTNN